MAFTNTTLPGPALVIGCIVLCLLAGFIGSAFTAQGVTTWYAGIEKPSWNPPNWVFGPVWTILYILMGISLAFVLSKGIDAPGARVAVLVFAVQLILNTLWSFLFFGMQSPLLGLAGIIPLWVAIVATIVLFYPLSQPAAGLLVPYLLWVSFAAFLNYSIYVLNPY